MRAAIGLGSNLPSEFGGREDNLREAIARVGALGSVVAVSGFYDTEPVGFTEQPRFLNAVAVVETLLEPVVMYLAPGVQLPKLGTVLPAVGL